MAFSNSTVSRLRASKPSKAYFMDANGVKPQVNGNYNAANTNGVQSNISSGKSLTSMEQHQALLQLLASAQQSETSLKGNYDELLGLVLHLLQQEAPNGVQSGPNMTLPATVSRTVSTSTKKKPLLVTPLGGMIINSSDEPIASVNPPSALPTAKSVTGSSDPRAAISEAAILRANPTAPQHRPQAQVWQDTIKAGRSGEPLNVNGDTLLNPSLITVDDSGNLVKVPLTAAVDASSTSIAVDKSIKPTLVQPPPVFGQFFVAAPTLASTAEVPAPLLQGNLAGNEAITVPAGFVLAGDVKLFGGKLDAELYTFHGTAGDEQAAMAVLSQSPVAIDDLLPSDVPFGSITLQHATITAFKNASPAGKDAGLWLGASIALTGPLEAAGTALQDIFAKSVASVDISAHIGDYQAVGDAFKAPSDVLFTATLTGLDVKIGKFLELTSATVDLHGVKGTSGFTWTTELSGDALITVPGAVAPLVSSYKITKAQSTYTIVLTLTEPQWPDAMGVAGFHLNNTTFQASFDSSSKDAPFSFDISASFALGSVNVSVTGHYSKDDWNFHATVGDFPLAQLEASFAKLFDAGLLPCPHDVAFTGLSLDITSQDKTLVLNGGVTIDTYTSANASLTLSPVGIHVTGKVTNAKFDAVTLQKAALELIITKSGLVNPSPNTPGTTAAFSISGEVVINSAVTIDAEVSFAKTATSTVWVVYAKAITNMPLSKFVDVPKDLDIVLDNLVAMASNTDDDSLFPLHTFDYKVKKGFRLTAKMDCPPALAKSLHTNPVGLILELDLAAAASEVEFIFAANQALSLKPGMVAPNVKAGIMLTANPQIFVEGDLAVQLSGNPGPLDFALRLSVGLTEAHASASLNSNWVNPFHISPQVKVLAPVSIDVTIDYLAVTYPSGFGIQGGIQVGDAKLSGAFEVGENPEDGVLLVHAQDLNLRDIVSFASLVTEKSLPLPSPDILEFKDLDLGISTGGTIGSTFYPPGVTFNADAIIFGKEIKIHCAVDEQLPGFEILGEIDAFALGPVTVSGDKTANPAFHLEFGTKLQQLSIDGKIALFDSDIATSIDVAMVPPSITFDAELKFSDLLTFKIDAHAAGEVKSIKDVVKSDFTLEALLEQQLLDHMMALANTFIATAKKASDEGLESAKAKLAQAQASFDSSLSKAQRDLDSAQAAWDKKSADVTVVANAQKKSLQDQEAANRAAVDQAQANFNAKIQSLTQQLQQTKQNAAADVQAAQNKLNQANNEATNAINGAKAQLDNAQKAMAASFGGAEQAIQSAQNRVNGAKSVVDSCQHQVDDCENNIHHGSFGDRVKAGFQIAGFETALVAAKGSLAVAQGVLTAANAVVQSAGFVAAKGAITVAQGALDAANAAATAGIAAAKGSLSAAQAAETASVSAAQATLDTAKQGCHELHVWDAAKDTLAAFLAVEQTGIDAANKFITDLASCAEKIAFDAANAAVNVAKSATKEVSAAQDILTDVEKGVNEFSSFGQWLINHAGNIFNVKMVEISGSLNDAANKKPFLAHVVGTFADANVDVQVEFTPGQAEDFVKGLVSQFVDEAKGDLTKFIH